MKKNKTTISKSKSYKEIGEFWDTHDLSHYWEKTEVTNFDVNIKSQQKYFPIDANLTKKIKKLAKKRGVKTTTLINLLLQEKISENVM
jgi:hypothetical protein